MRDLNDLTRPTVPSGAIQQRMLVEIEGRRGTVGPAPALSDNAGTPTALRAILEQAVAEPAPQIVELSHDIHDYPEVGYEEHHVVAMVAGFLCRHGTEPEVGICSMDTALRAEILGGGGADAVAGGSCELAGTTAVLAEYDTLPGIGHGCGHNVICANSVGTFLALATLVRARSGSLPGRVALQTTPAEENSTAEEILAVRGMLDGVDAAIQTCPYAHDVTHQTWLGARRLRVILHNAPAHVASRFFMGRNALDVATLALAGIGLLC